MPWVRLDDGMYTHPKIGEVSAPARWLLIASICYSNQNATDGRLSRGAAESVGFMPQPGKAIAELVAVGLWERDGAGYRIHDYDQYQPSREKILRDRKAAAERQARFRNGSGHGSGNGARNGVTDGVTDGATDGVTAP
jgi:hypothetical protein